jgi:hypothetical protein
MIKCGMVKWEKQTACIEHIRTRHTVLVENPEQRDNLENLDIDGKILTWCLRKGCESVE